MDAGERALLERTVLDALTAHVGVAGPDAPADDVLAGLGWAEMLEAEPPDAVAVVFTALGVTAAPGGALDEVVAPALGLGPRADLAVVLPASPPGGPPARHDAAWVRGLAGLRA